MEGNLTKRISAAGIIIALGIAFGDIGTSPLYTINAIVRDKIITELLIIGSVSCIIWTLTLLTTIKYVVMVLNADNKGEGGILSLYTLVRRHAKWIIFFAMVGGATLLADGIITPAITVTSSIEGFGLKREGTIGLVLIILAGVFFMQQFGTNSIGRIFGPVMVVWFLTLGILGLANLWGSWEILKAINPYYAVEFLIHYPKGFWLLGSIFLCTTGAESLYSDLGHCGKRNIRVSWTFVKICLVLNYVGQAAYLLHNYEGNIFPADQNLFFALAPNDTLKILITVIATLAAIIASQALISGSFSLINEAIKLNIWPKLKVIFPSTEKGQIFVPAINAFLWIGSSLMVIYFGSSASMEGAYGLSITVTMLMTTMLFSLYLYVKKVHRLLIGLFLLVYLTVEGAFLIANLEKFPPPQNGFVIIIIAGAFFAIMYTWFRARKIKNRYVEFVKLDDYLPIIQELSNDRSITKYATHLVYLTSANHKNEVEHKVIYSILYNKPKRADIYWLVHVDVVDNPYTMEYVVQTIIPNEIIRIEFRLGFRVEQRIQLMFKKVVEDLVANREVNVTSRYESLSRNNVRGDFRFIVMEKFLSRDNELPIIDKLIMKAYFILKKFSLSEERGFGLDASDVIIEKFPLLVSNVADVNLKRVE